MSDIKTIYLPSFRKKDIEPDPRQKRVGHIAQDGRPFCGLFKKFKAFDQCLVAEGIKTVTCQRCLKKLLNRLQKKEKKCVRCGCTDRNACVRDGTPCHWASHNPPICSSCK